MCLWTLETWILIMNGLTMTNNRFIFLCIGAASLMFAGCSKMTDGEQEVNAKVNFSIDSESVDLDMDTELVPMARAEILENYKNFCLANARHVVMKRIPDSQNEYLVVDVTEIQCKDNNGNKASYPSNIRIEDYKFKLAQETLQPGDYRGIVILNAAAGVRKGDVVNENTNIISKDLFLRPRSIYVGYKDFTVTKNGELQEQAGQNKNITYDEIIRYTTPINIIIIAEQEGTLNSNFTMNATVKYDYPNAINCNGELIYENIGEDKAPINTTIAYNILTRKTIWSFAKYNATLNPTMTSIYPLVYTKDRPKDVQVNISKISMGMEEFFYGNIEFEVTVTNGKPMNVIIQFDKNKNYNVITEQKTVNDMWNETKNVEGADPFIPLNYVEYNPDNYETN